MFPVPSPMGEGEGAWEFDSGLFNHPLRRLPNSLMILLYIRVWIFSGMSGEDLAAELRSPERPPLLVGEREVLERAVVLRRRRPATCQSPRGHGYCY